MNPYVKAALFLTRLAGFGLVTVGGFLVFSNLAAFLVRKPVQKPLLLALEVVVLFAGVAVLWKSRTIARRLVNDLDDEEDGEA
jgi:hypothetical protein